MAKRRSAGRGSGGVQEVALDAESVGRYVPDEPPLLDLGEVLGQGRAVRDLLAALDRSRVHHAWLFAGPMGVGKRSTAEAFAAMLLDPTLDHDLTGNLTVDPTGRTRALMADRNHPDVHLVNKELAAISRDDSTRSSKQRSIPVDVLHEFLIEPAFRASTMGGRSSGGAQGSTHGAGARASKVFIIDEAELLAIGDGAAQNAILKTLEEPPAGTVIILIANREHRLLPTIRSRCQRVAFTTLDEPAMSRWMDRMEFDASDDERAWVLSFAAGSPGRAKLAFDTGLFEWGRVLTPMLEALDNRRFDPKLGETMAAFVEDWAKRWVSTRPAASKEAANHAAVGHMLHVIAEWYRVRLRTNEAERAARALELVADAERHANANVNLKMTFAELATQLAET